MQTTIFGQHTLLTSRRNAGARDMESVIDFLFLYYLNINLTKDLLIFLKVKILFWK